MAKIKVKKVIDGQRYTIEVWMMRPINGIYRFGLQIWGAGNVSPFAMRLTEEFIEDEIDNKKNKDYLERVAMKVAENHLMDMLNMNSGTVAAKLKYWFIEAKRQLEKEKKTL
jgi:hypothetical protein